MWTKRVGRNSVFFLKMLFHGYGGLSQWGRLNRKIDPCRMLVWLGRRTVQNMEPSYHRIRSIHAVIWQAGTNSILLRPRVHGMLEGGGEDLQFTNDSYGRGMGWFFS